VNWLRGANIDLIRGHARLAGERRVTVTDRSGETIELTGNEHSPRGTKQRQHGSTFPGWR
jgi:hypothetical protein